MDIQTAVVLIGTFIGTIMGAYWMARQGAVVPDRSQKYQQKIEASNGATYLRTGSDEAAKALTDSNLNLSLAISQLLRQSERENEEQTALQEKVERLEKQIEHHERETSVMQSRINAMEDQLIEKARQISALQRADGENKREILLLRGQNERLTKEVESLRELVQARTEERDQALAQARNLEQELLDMSLRFERIEKTQTDELKKLEENHDKKSDD